MKHARHRNPKAEQVLEVDFFHLKLCPLWHLHRLPFPVSRAPLVHVETRSLDLSLRFGSQLCC